MLKYVIDDKNWKDLTDIQKEAIPVILNGNDCIIEAPTSGGKTEAVLFPTLTTASNNKAEGVRILYIAPLKALLNDIELRAKVYAPLCGLRSFKWHGDVSQTEKLKQIILPPQLLLTTPESLEAILLRKPDWTKLFSNLQSVIIDETHSFALGDRGSHLLSILERIEYDIKLKPQRIALTATIGNPDELLSWLAGNKRIPGVKISVQSKFDKEKDYKICHFDDELDELESGINNARDLTEYLYKLLALKKTIVFGNSRSNTEQIAKFVNEKNKLINSKNPIQVRTHHSSVSKYYRELAEDMIKIKSETGINAIISTSTLELGIDIGELDQVIQMGGLSSSSSFLQRVGRTGRRDGKPQFFRALTQNKEDLILMCACINLGLKRISEAINFSKKAYHILVHQIICLSLQKNGISVDEAWQIFSGAYCFKNISKDKFLQLIEFMIKNDLIRDTDGIVVGEVVERQFLFANWKRLFAVFDGGPMYNVVNGKEHVGMLDCAFARSQKIPFLFVLGGIEWEAIKINHETQQVLVHKTKIGTAPKWNVFGSFDVPYETAQEVGRILTGKSSIDFLDKNAASGIEYLRNHYYNLKWEENTWIIEMEGLNKICLWTFGGEKLNRTIANFIDTDQNIKSTYDYKCIVIKKEEGTNNTDHKEQNEFSNTILNLLNQIYQLIHDEIANKIKTNIVSVNYSKFSKFIPEDLSKESIIDSNMDVGLLKKIFSEINIKIFRNEKN
ncbi:MAG TPA: DEAD/DEAH box helicase [Ignavibacteria bacterium]|nr:DEAD/DEAH box helicase [Ignavibacteria bacterium]HMR41838.1 DEAD/DEAH box helicase [Ignavibacteria bacterium]